MCHVFIYTKWKKTGKASKSLGTWQREQTFKGKQLKNEEESVHGADT